MTDLVTIYVERLERSLGDETDFAEAYKSLAGDSKVDAATAKSIANRFAGKPGKSKIEALSLVLSRHNFLMDATYRAKAIGNRSAS